MQAKWQEAKWQVQMTMKGTNLGMNNPLLSLLTFSPLGPWKFKPILPWRDRIQLKISLTITKKSTPNKRYKKKKIPLVLEVLVDQEGPKNWRHRNGNKCYINVYLKIILLHKKWGLRTPFKIIFSIFPHCFLVRHTF